MDPLTQNQKAHKCIKSNWPYSSKDGIFGRDKKDEYKKTYFLRKGLLSPDLSWQCYFVLSVWIFAKKTENLFVHFIVSRFHLVDK